MSARKKGGRHQYSPEFFEYLTREFGGRTGWETPDRIMCGLFGALAALALVLAFWLLAIL